MDRSFIHQNINDLYITITEHRLDLVRSEVQ